MIKCVVPISGGKDSQACLKLALHSFDKTEILGLFCDTKFEHPLTYTHIDKMRQIYGVTITTICGGSVEEKVLKYKRFPGGGARHCTDELKIVPSKKFYKDLAVVNGPFQVWYGMRSGESSERAKRYINKIDMELYSPHEVLRKYPKYLGKLGVRFRLPVIDFTESEILALCEGELNPLYGEGFGRVGCFPCLASGDTNKEKAFAHDEFGKQQKVIVMRLSKEIGKNIFTSKSGIERNACSFCSY